MAKFSNLMSKPTFEYKQLEKAVLIKILNKANLNAENINLPLAFGMTPIYIAAASGEVSQVVNAINTGADVNVSNLEVNDEESALYAATSNNDYQIAQILITHGANVSKFANFQDQGMCTPLYAAIKNNNIELAQLLIAHGADLNAIRVIKDKIYTANDFLQSNSIEKDIIEWKIILSGKLQTFTINIKEKIKNGFDANKLTGGEITTLKNNKYAQDNVFKGMSQQEINQATNAINKVYLQKLPIAKEAWLKSDLFELGSEILGEISSYIDHIDLGGLESSETQG